MAVIDTAGLRQARLTYSKKSMAKAIAIFLLVLAGYVCAFIGALASPLPWSVLFSLALGWLTGILFVIGHDACHHSYTSSRRINAVVGRIAMLPSLHNFSLWDLGHNRIHHRHNNVRGFDYVWEPMSPDDYEASSPVNRALYRLTRSPIGILFYYAFDIWFPKIFLVRKKGYCLKYGAYRREYLLDGILVWSFLVAQIILIWSISEKFGKGPIEAILLAFVIPFTIWNMLMSFVIYLHHTHPDVPWYASVDDWRAQGGALTGVVHVRFPLVIRKALLEIMEHNAHHFAPGVPLYNLASMQATLPKEKIIEWQWTLPGFWRIATACQLYDYDQKCWVRFP